jgi:hypothetical protein
MPCEPLKIRTLLFLENSGSNYPFMLLITGNKEKLNNTDNETLKLAKYLNYRPINIIYI